MTVSEALAAGSRRLAEAGVANPARDARRLLAHALDVPSDRLTLMAREDVGHDAAARFEGALAARVRRQPVSQIVGWRDFYGRRFRVTPDVLDPRPETELLVDLALREPFRDVLDLGTGSGCLLLTLLAERPEARGIGTDVSREALAVARENAAALRLSPKLRLSNWFERVDGVWDLIVSNPPYIADDELAALEPEVRQWEPWLALTPGGDGLDAYRSIAIGAVSRLCPGARLILEIGTTQADEVAALLEERGLTEIAVHADLDGQDRAVTARKGA
ncbi:peptide chain release factor N(5)-glutamine methyltransferase [Roseitranquillus sediminis]|uniref:peptide chain release factor N(5)-glutamine methyltransferase n=1 Tax=Roseitranquillus sediminis TaxID=2809051 RepID=UPI001D0C0EA2|nr:peptide chain release factor N(5)-glutamine methyltransferase [Roseitranquillus sediminis]MBM9594364.1 peptide chain release factor N(5)-glutamine methyltransferase [Roseitranquillus sediminis]